MMDGRENVQSASGNSAGHDIASSSTTTQMSHRFCLPTAICEYLPAFLSTRHSAYYYCPWPINFNGKGQSIIILIFLMEKLETMFSKIKMHGGLTGI